MSEEPTIDSLQQELSDAKDLIDNQERGMWSLREDLSAARAQIALANAEYQQCDTKLKDALCEVELLRAWRKAAMVLLLIPVKCSLTGLEHDCEPRQKIKITHSSGAGAI